MNPSIVFVVVLGFCLGMDTSGEEIFPDQYYEKFSSHLGSLHTMVKYKGFGKKCDIGGEFMVAKSGPLTENEKHMFLLYHNNYRRKVSTGKEHRGAPGPQPQAANMITLTWDEELATFAQRWAEQCPDSYVPHDVNRRNDRWEWVGQNSFADKRSSLPKLGIPDPPIAAPVEKTLKMWSDEVSYMNNSNISPFMTIKHAKNYSQLMWADTKKIGCGFFMRRREERHGWYVSKMFDRYVVCNYGVGGNVDGLDMYLLGAPGTSCPTGSWANLGLCTFASKTNPEKTDSEVSSSVSTCPSDMFQCLNGKCISLAWVCDKTIDCRSGEDETNCQTTPESRNLTTTSSKMQIKGNYMFAVGRGHAVYYLQYVIPCVNEEDFQCDDGVCIPHTWRCDGVFDCVNGTDEDETCNYHTCHSREFQCISGRCISLAWRCDEMPDCDAHEDEENCSTEE